MICNGDTRVLFDGKSLSFTGANPEVVSVELPKQ